MRFAAHLPVQRRMRRVNDFLESTMHPFEEREETVHEKTFRLSRVALTVLRKSAFVIPMGAIIPVMLRAADLGLRYVSAITSLQVSYHRRDAD
jgi:hypothetical protein